MESNVQKNLMTRLHPVIAFLKNKYFKFGFVSAIYILWVIWLQNYWFLFGLIIIFDLYITRKVNWTFWKKRGEKNSVWIEWLDALIFAVIAVTIINIFLFQNYKIPTPSMEKSLLIGDHLYVSKVAYGPRMPNTPLSFPFTQNTMPIIKTKSYVEWIKRPYKRLAGFGKVKRDDVVVFNFPAGDTVVLAHTERSYYSIVRDYAMQIRESDQTRNNPLRSWEEYLAAGREMVWNDFEIISRPVDRRDNYIKRCVAIHGDTLQLIHGQIYINGTPSANYKHLQHRYFVTTDGSPINPKRFDQLGISKDDREQMRNTYILPLTDRNVEILRNYTNVVSVEKYETPVNSYNYQIFPHDSKYPWTLDNYGPLWIPEKGVTIDLNIDNLPKYKRIIEQYEDNDLKVADSTIYINGETAETYTFKMNYFFMIGDNRHYSSDCRYWGFVPEDHILGKPKFIWLSLDKDKKFIGKIRWKRMFKSTDNI
jgi:signal peptidase I